MGESTITKPSEVFQSFNEQILVIVTEKDQLFWARIM